jgi:hypothetical protein
MQSLAVQHLNRPASSAPGAMMAARLSIDFVVDGESLLAQLLKVDGGYGDFMGCFVQGFRPENLKKQAQLADAIVPDTEEGRYLLYVCPECGDIGCGAYGAKIRITENSVEWYEFAYENGSEPGRALPSIGPFSFAKTEYAAALQVAGAA